MPGDYWQKCANLRLLLGYMFAEPGKKLIFMGGEFGQTGEWNHDSQLSWELLGHPLHQGLAGFTRDLNRLYHREPALYERDFEDQGFEWLDFHDHDSTVVSFIRRGFKAEDELLFVFNFTPVPRYGYRLGAPGWGYYQELLNSDSAYYGGSDLGLAGGAHTDPVGAHGRSQSLNLTLPPLGFLVLKRS
jgi:1,4-alpha-glucan branching enzyme